jgi:O-antigen biosynthesis protein
MKSNATNPLVSVLIPTWNGARYLHETLDCILAQTYGPLEIIVSDDGSTDTTLAIVQDYQHKSPLAITLLHNPDKGMVNNWNHCIKSAQGEFVKFVFQDDLITPTCIEKLVNAAGNDVKIGMVYSRRQLLMSGGAELNQHCREIFDGCQDVHQGWGTIAPVQSGLEYLSNPAFFSGSSNKIGEPSVVLLRKSLFDRIGYFDNAYLHLMDFDMWARVMANSTIAFVDEALAVFRIHPDQQSVKNLASGEINQDMVLFAHKVISEPCLSAAPLAFRQRSLGVVEKLLHHYQRESLDYQQQRDLGSKQNGALNNQVETLNSHIDTLSNQVGILNNQAGALNSQIDVLNNHIVTLNEHSEALLQNKEAIIQALRHDLDIIYNSRSWKLTKPLRLYNKIKYFWRVEGFAGIAKRVHFKLFRRAPRLPMIAVGVDLSSIRPLQFPVYEQPLISIVIPVYNKIEYTFHCLASVLQNSSEVPYEVIVVDDCSSDKTQKVLAKISGIKVIRNAKNGGFIYSCNAGAAAARGEYLLMLNNDTEPQAGWLAALLNTFTDFPDAGMVGAKLLFGNGTLQEAGGIVWRDGSAWNYGRGSDPNRPEYSYCRAVDYCSGACLLLPRADYLALGQFDSHYAPAYYEDTDLAFKVRQAGKQVYYQPNARIVHFEGISNGTDTGGGVKAYQIANHQKFLARWTSVLLTHRPPGFLPEWEKERTVYKRVLVMDARVLMPDNDSGSLRMFNVLKVLQDLGYKVSFMPINLQYDERYTPMMQALGIECWYLPYQSSIEQHFVQYGASYDVVILSRADIAEPAIDLALKHSPNARLIFDTVDLHFLRERRSAQLSGSKSEAAAAELRRLQELGIARKAHTTLVVSPVEVELFKKEAPDVKVALLSNIHSVHGCAKPWAERRNILFIGTFEHPPNIDAMHYFIDEVLPLLLQKQRDIKLSIIGAHAPSSLLAKAGPHVEFLGFVPDIAPMFASVRLSIAPLRYGAGVKGKLNSSMSYGVPVVASPIAAEGMGLTHEKDVLIADTPAAFADAIVRAYNDAALWQRLSQASLANIESNFSFALATEQLRQVLA